MSCPACNCIAIVWLGKLGERSHVKCRDCGMPYSYIDEPEADDPWEDDEDRDDDEPDGQPDEMQEWHDFDPDC